MKTKRSITLPLLPEIGNAIIDYLKNGRPLSNDSHCFLQLNSPYKPIEKGSIGNIVNHHLMMSGINCKGRKHGSHALRHSLAGNLLSNKTSIPVISEVLGHKSIETTMSYLRVDLSGLRQCTLDVPMITSTFYDQEGGINYV
jgi:site-specific recombinase XerD